MKRLAQRGFTLIEIMVALVISTLVVAMILGIFTSMSAAYRTQQQVAELQQVLQAANAMLEGDLHQAGYRCPQGFTWAGSPTVALPSLQITDGGTAVQQPDQIAIFYGDPSKQASVLNWTGTNGVSSVIVDAVDATWVVGDLALLSVQGQTNIQHQTFEWQAATPPSPLPPEEPGPGDTTDSGAFWVPYYACVVQISGITGTTVTFSQTGSYGIGNNTQCKTAQGIFASSHLAMLVHFVGHAYRIDPTASRKSLSVFQQSPSGALVANDWTDMGLGFTNFQIASRWYEMSPGADNADTDTDPMRNWYSNAQQTTEAAASVMPTVAPTAVNMTSALQVSVSFVVRTTRRVVDGTVTAATPQLEDPANVNCNDVGDSPSFTLAGVADAARPTELQGDNIYRYSTIKVDTRNLGNGR